MSLGENFEAAPQEMSIEQLMRQCELLPGRLIVYRAYSEGDGKANWVRYVGRLLHTPGQPNADRTSDFAVEVGPQYGYIPRTERFAEHRVVPLPANGYKYTRIVAATVFLAEYGRWLSEQLEGANTQVAQLQGQVAHLTQLQQLTATQLAQAKQGQRATQGTPGQQGQQGQPQRQQEGNQWWQDLDDEEGVQENRAPNPIGMVVETELVAFSPEMWNFDVHEAQRLVGFLQTRFAPVLANKTHRHHAQDAINIIQHMVMLNSQSRQLHLTAPWQIGMRIPVKRLLLAEKAVNGHAGAYIAELASAMDGTGKPRWIVDAEKQAAAVLKNTSVTKPRKN